MKKLMMAAAIVCAAAYVQAAQIMWGGGLCSPDGEGYIDAPATAVLLWSSSAFSGSATEISGLTMGATADNGGTVVDTFSITADISEAASFSANYSKSGAGVDGYYAVLIGNSEGTMATYYDLGQISGTSATTPTIDKKVNEDLAGEHYLTEGGYNTAVVPEPTSGLLLLLGVAGMALRRRRA